MTRSHVAMTVAALVCAGVVALETQRVAERGAATPAAPRLWWVARDRPGQYGKNKPHKGHFHVGTAEWWIILEGQIRHNNETVGDFTSSAGDVVYAPASTWHATRFAGPGPSCRLATSTYQFTSLLEVPQD